MNFDSGSKMWSKRWHLGGCLPRIPLGEAGVFPLFVTADAGVFPVFHPASVVPIVLCVRRGRVTVNFPDFETLWKADDFPDFETLWKANDIPDFLIAWTAGDFPDFEIAWREGAGDFLP